MASFIIAEAGVNFNGNIATAQKMAKTAKECGADAVKFQTFWNIGCLKEYEMPKEQWRELKDYCYDIGIEFMSTPHWGSPIGEFYKDSDYDVIDFVDQLVKRHKIASPYLTNQRYVKNICRGKPIIISTGSIIHEDGMATMDEIERCLNWVSGEEITLLHCVSQYPDRYAFNWRRVEELKRFGYPVGLSDHGMREESNPYPIVERHFKLDDDCIDWEVSSNPEQFAEMVKKIRSRE